MSLPYYRVFSNSDALAMALMSCDERGAYHYLRNLSWDQDPPGTLPDDDQLLARAAALPLKRWLAVRPVALKGWISDGTRLVDAAFQDEYARSEKVSKGAINSNMDRWHGKENPSDRISDRTPDGLRTDSSLSLSSSLTELRPRQGLRSPDGELVCNASEIQKEVGLSNNKQADAPLQNNGAVPTSEQTKKPPSPPSHSFKDAFEVLFETRFWPAFPRKQRKKAALAMFKGLGPGGDVGGLLDKMLAQLNADKRYWSKHREQPDLPDDWLREQPWKFEHNGAQR